jgi:hypothetical protein
MLIFQQPIVVFLLFLVAVDCSMWVSSLQNSSNLAGPQTLHETRKHLMFLQV